MVQAGNRATIVNGTGEMRTKRPGRLHGALAALLAAVILLPFGSASAQTASPTPAPAPQAVQPVPVRPGSAEVPQEFLKPPTGEKAKRLEEQAKWIREHRSKSFEEMLEKWLTPKPYPKSQVVWIDKKHAYPHRAVPWKMEVVKVEGDTVWLRGLPPEDPESAIHPLWVRIQQLEEQAKTAVGMEKEMYYLEPIPVVQEPPSVDRLRFEKAGTELPEKGRWRMNVAFGDFDGDGIEDLVAPPPRKGSIRTPVIFLGKGDGSFQPWKRQRWETSVRLDYGGVGVADFDGDGNLDVVIGVHFGGQHVFYGDGKGGFGQPDTLPRPDPRLSSRALAVADFDGNGRPDVAFVAEAAVDLRTNEKIEAPTVWVCLNGGRGKWTLQTDGLPEAVIADNLAAADLDGDGRPDLVVPSSVEGWRMLAFLDEGGKGWKHLPRTKGVLSDAYHFDIAPLPRKASDVSARLAATFEQFYPTTPVEGTRARTGIILYDITPFGIQARGTPVLRDDDRTNPYFRIAAGDIDGDGRTDLAVARKNGAIRVLLGDPSAEAGYVLERGTEIAGVGRPYDLAIRDVDGDGLGDVVVMAAPNDAGPGGITVWLTRRAGK